MLFPCCILNIYICLYSRLSGGVMLSGHLSAGMVLFFTLRKGELIDCFQKKRNKEDLMFCELFKKENIELCVCERI